MRTPTLPLATLAIALAATAPRAQEAQPSAEGPRVAWVKGPATVDLGDAVAQLAVPEGYAFAGAADARAILEQNGNRTDGSELGLLVPAAEDQSWFIVFDWQPVGYVKDDDKDEIDADGILKGIQQATEDGNAWRKEHGIPALHVTGWAEPPRYDEATHHLVWATLAHSEDGVDSANYNMRLLGRHGFVSATLVESPDRLAVSKPQAHAVVGGFAFKPGRSYAEWKPGDKVAEYGLTALVAAGAGAAAVKTGLLAGLGKLLAKGGKAVVLGLAAVAAALGKLWNAARGRATARREPPPEAPPAV